MVPSNLQELVLGNKIVRELSIKKRAISFSLAVVLSLEAMPVVALAADDITPFFDTMSNSTTAGTWQSPGGTTYMYGGAYTFKFKNTQRYRPLVQGEMPSIKASCAGMSLKGGFLSLLGLSDLGDDLKNAGSQVAWGIMLGLIYSLPGVADVFKTIQQWAKYIQMLLQNACQMARNITENFLRNSGTTSKMDKMFNDNVIGQGYESAKSALDGGLVKTQQYVTDFVNNVGNSNPTDANNAVTGAIAQDFGALYLADAQAGTIAQKIGKNMGEIQRNGAIVGSLQEVVTSGTLSDALGGANTINIQLNAHDKLDIKMQLMFIGDTRLTDSAIEEVESIMDNGHITQQATITDTVKRVSGDKEVKPREIKSAIIPPIISYDKTYDALINGFTKDNCPADKYQGDGTFICNIPNRWVYALSGQTNAASSAGAVNNGGLGAGSSSVMYTHHVALGTDYNSNNQGFDNAYIPFEWHGLYTESLKGVIQLVRSKMDNSAVSGTIYAPLVLSNMSRYTAAIAQYAKRRNITIPSDPQQSSGNVEVDGLIQVLAYSNALFVAEKMFASIKGRLIAAGDEASSKGGSVDGVKQAREHALQAFKASEDVLKDAKASLSSENFLVETFEKLEGQMKIDTMQRGVR